MAFKWVIREGADKISKRLDLIKIPTGEPMMTLWRRAETPEIATQGLLGELINIRKAPLEIEEDLI